jgi:tetratricopeptide (TPR) repeat protein
MSIRFAAFFTKIYESPLNIPLIDIVPESANHSTTIHQIRSYMGRLQHFCQQITLVAACVLVAASASAEQEATKSSAELVNQAYALFESGQNETALEKFNRVLADDAGHLSARLGQAMVLLEERRHKDAFHAYDLIVKSYPSHAFAWNGRGLAAFNLENFDEALSSFERATADQPINGFFYESLAWTYLCRGDYTEAAQSAKQATLMYNQNGETAAYPLLIAYFSQLEGGRKADAIRTLKYAQSNKPPNGSWPTPIFDYLSGRLSGADLISFVTDSAEETEAHTYIGLNLRSQGNHEAAQPHLNWVALKGNDRVFEHTLARTLKAPKKVARRAP